MIVGLPAWQLLSPRGGVGNVLWHLLDEYGRLAPADRFIVYHDGPDPDLPAAANLTARRVRLPVGQNNLTWNSLALPPALRRDRVELVHNVGYVLPAGVRGPAVVTVHDVSYARHPEWFAPKPRWFFDRGTRRAVRRATIVTDSRFSAREISALYGLPEERIAVVPLGVEERFRPLDETALAAVRRELELPERFVLFLGGALRRRRVDQLIAACARVLPAVDAHLVLAGHGGEIDVAAEIARWGLGGRVRLLGSVPGDALPGLYNAATCFAWPSIYEGFGLPPLEALACGTPTVVADASSLPEVVGEAALRVPPDDVDALAAALRRLLTDAALRAELAAAGPVRAARFTWRATAEAMLALYRRVLETGS